jgi:hypothetical protein
MRYNIKRNARAFCIFFWDQSTIAHFGSLPIYAARSLCSEPVRNGNVGSCSKAVSTSHAPNAVVSYRPKPQLLTTPSLASRFIVSLCTV